MSALHTHAPSEALDDAIAALALERLNGPDPASLSDADRALAEAQLSSCAACREQLADLERALGGIGLSFGSGSIDQVTDHDAQLPASLRDRVMKITSTPQLSRVASPASSRTLPFRAPEPETETRPRGSVVMSPAAGGPSNSSVVAWLAVAASLALVVAASWYAMMARQQATDALNQRQAANARVASLQNELAALESRLSVINAPDVVKLDLQAQPDAPGSAARVFMSATRGIVVTAEHLPALAAGRTYQLWVVTKQAPVSIGTFDVQSDGSMSGTMKLSADATLNPVAVAVTIEPAGGVPAPTGPKVLVGVLAQ